VLMKSFSCAPSLNRYVAQHELACGFIFKMSTIAHTLPSVEFEQVHALQINVLFCFRYAYVYGRNYGKPAAVLQTSSVPVWQC
jgi:hypothetical protein